MPDRPSARALAGELLRTPDPDRLVAGARSLHRRWLDGGLSTAPPAEVLAPDEVGRPERPALVAPRGLRPRGLGTPEGRIAAVHAVAHIELNAIRLALDAVHRFDGLPEAYHGDWLGVADDEARHFGLLADRLAELGARYGDLPAHDGLWAAAARTADDPLRRMALVPRVLEARGLDVTPAMRERFRAAGDDATDRVLGVILADEVGHVAVGTRWFEHLCAQRGLDPAEAFLRLLDEDGARVAPPFNEAARLAAGFTADELAALRARAARWGSARPSATDRS